MPDSQQGGCHCGAIRYQVNGVLDDIAHCHCSICRRTSGGILTTWATLPLSAFVWLHGTPRQHASSVSCTRYFCGDCGAQLALYTRLSPGSLDITVATLDHPESAPADRQIWVQDRLPWLRLAGSLPEEPQEYLGPSVDEDAGTP
ncbi:MAG: GFA family protein [Pseudomonas sp.]|uniref:GFA family protein n=1 Tax=Pseudomonas sp. TaxID=306 RepID=UPI0033974A9C